MVYLNISISITINCLNNVLHNHLVTLSINCHKNKYFTIIICWILISIPVWPCISDFKTNQFFLLICFIILSYFSNNNKLRINILYNLLLYF